MPLVVFWNAYVPAPVLVKNPMDANPVMLSSSVPEAELPAVPPFATPSWPVIVLLPSASVKPDPVAPPVNVPVLVKDDASTLEASVAPVSVPAGATTAAVVCAVTRPLPVVVKTGMAVDEPTEPGLPLTVARVATAEPGPVAVTSPVSAEIPFPPPPPPPPFSDVCS